MEKTKTKKTAAKANISLNGNGQHDMNSSDRLKVLKTYKLYIGGKFPRTESGRYFVVNDKNNKPLANICLGSRKDFRNAVVAARKAFNGWAGKTAFNRSQILYRMAEMLESRSALFIEELTQLGYTQVKAEDEVAASVDRLIYYAGWCDKYQQVFGTVNPVASSHFNFSVPEPMGVVVGVAPNNYPLLGMVSLMAPVIAGGNSCVVLASEINPLCSISFAEVLNDSDLPGGVVNILTGKEDELYSHFASHMDVNQVIYAREEAKHLTEIKEAAVLNVKRVLNYTATKWNSEEAETPYRISDSQEIKTTWHPVGV